MPDGSVQSPRCRRIIKGRPFAVRSECEPEPLAPWANRRRHELLELLDRLDPTIAELSQAVEQEVEKCPEAQRLATHPGVGPLTALAFVLIIGKASPRFSRLARTRNLFPFFAHYLVFISCMERLQLASPPGQRIERLVPPLPQIFRKPRTTPLGPFYRLRRPPILPFADRTRVPRGLGHPPKFSRRRAEQLCLHKTGNVPVPQKRRDAVDVRS